MSSIPASSFRMYIINAFIPPSCSSALGAGNPAAVVLLSASESAWLTDASRQALARELNLSETAFVTGQSGGGTFGLRWFTPGAEVELCGHATLAAAHALLEAGWAHRGEDIRFETRESGVLVVSSTASAADASGKELQEEDEAPLQMSFPLLSKHDSVADAARDGLLDALGVAGARVRAVFRSDYDMVVEVHAVEDVRAIAPGDMDGLAGATKAAGARGVIVAARTEADGFACRFFAPGVGVAEDPVTGSAMCALAAAFLEADGAATASQLSARGGVVRVRRSGHRVLLGGWARTVVAGSVNSGVLQ